MKLQKIILEVQPERFDEAFELGKKYLAQLDWSNEIDARVGNNWYVVRRNKLGVSVKSTD